MRGGASKRAQGGIGEEGSPAEGMNVREKKLQSLYRELASLEK